MLKQKLIISIAGIIFISANCNAQLYDSVNFEQTSNTIWIDTTGNPLWQTGAPEKSFFNAPHGGLRAMVTDTSNAYPASDTTSFIYTIRAPYTYTCYTTMEFWHKFDTDTLTDVGLIDISYDGGNSWVQAKDTGDIMPWYSWFWWDWDLHESTGEYTPHQLVISGKSDGWVLSRFNWQWFIPVKSDTIISNPDSLMVRFTFISDGIDTGKEGWMIDDILTVSADWQGCSSVHYQELPGQLAVFPNPLSTQASVVLKQPLDNAELYLYSMSGQIVQHKTGLQGTAFPLSGTQLLPGVYVLILKDRNKRFDPFKVIISR